MLGESGVAEQVRKIIEPSLDGLGYRTVMVRFEGIGKALVLLVEPKEPRHMSLDDCTKASRMASALLDVDDPICGPYRLEVSSPGIDRPLMTLEDFIAYTGFEAKLESEVPVEGRKRFRGTITGVEGQVIHLKTEEGDAALPFGQLSKARLVLTDALLAHAKQQITLEEHQEVNDNG